MIKKLFLIIISICVLLIIGFYIITKGKGTYEISEGIGYSKTMEESKERGVFVKELGYKIIPNSIYLNENISFFIEKGFRYGKYSAKETLPLRETDDYIYQLRIERDTAKVFKGPYWSSGSEYSRFHVIEDTLKIDIVIRKPPYDSIYKVGELLLFNQK